LAFKGHYETDANNRNEDSGKVVVKFHSPTLSGMIEAKVGIMGMHVLLIQCRVNIFDVQWDSHPVIKP
jgi:hypothetical protein